MDEWDQLLDFVQKMKGGQNSSSIPPVIKPVPQSDLSNMTPDELNSAFENYHNLRKQISSGQKIGSPTGQQNFPLENLPPSPELQSPSVINSKATDNLLESFGFPNSSQQTSGANPGTLVGEPFTPETTGPGVPIGKSFNPDAGLPTLRNSGLPVAKTIPEMTPEISGLPAVQQMGAVAPQLTSFQRLMNGLGAGAINSTGAGLGTDSWKKELSDPNSTITKMHEKRGDLDKIRNLFGVKAPISNEISKSSVDKNTISEDDEIPDDEVTKLGKQINGEDSKSDGKAFGPYADNQRYLDALNNGQDLPLDDEEESDPSAVAGLFGRSPERTGGGTTTKTNGPGETGELGKMSLDQIMDYVNKRNPASIDLDKLRQDIKDQQRNQLFQKAFEQLGAGLSGAIGHGVTAPAGPGIEQDKLNQEQNQNLMKNGLSEYEQQQNRNTKQFDMLARLKELEEKTNQTNLLRQSLNDQKQAGLDLKHSDAQDKAYSDMRKAVETFRGNTAVQQAATGTLNAKKALDILKQYPDPNKMPPDMIKLFTSEIGKIAQSGSPTEHTLKSITPPGLGMSASTLISKITNAPNGAEQGKYIKQYSQYLDNILNTSNDTVNEYKANIAKGFFPRIKPEHQEEFMNDYPDSIPYIKFGKGKIDELMKTHPGIDTNIAKKMLMDRYMEKQQNE